MGTRDVGEGGRERERTKERERDRERDEGGDRGKMRQTEGQATREVGDWRRQEEIN